MNLITKVYGILVNDKDEILLKRDDLSLPGGDIEVGIDLIESVRNVVKKENNIEMIDIILFDELSKIEDNHILGIFYIGTFKREDREKYRQEYGWYKLRKLDLDNVDYFTKYIVDQIIGEN